MATPYAVTLWMSSNSLRGPLCRPLACCGGLPPLPPADLSQQPWCPVLFFRIFFVYVFSFKEQRTLAFFFLVPHSRPHQPCHHYLNFISPYTSTPLLYGLGGVSEWGKGRGAAARRPPGCCVPDGNLKPGASPPHHTLPPPGQKGAS